MDSDVDGQRVVFGGLLQSADKGTFGHVSTKVYRFGGGGSYVVGSLREEESLDGQVF